MRERARCTSCSNAQGRPGVSTNATYCCEEPSCYAGRQAYASSAARFRCHATSRGTTAMFCGGAPCFGWACNCSPGESCVDTVTPAAPAGKACNIESGGACVSNAIAEAVFGFAASEILFCCTGGCPAGMACEAGAGPDSRYAFQRLVGTCGSCGNGTCDAAEGPSACPADCRCGDAVCSVGEDAISCARDCGGCGDGTCAPWESPKDCAADCAYAGCGDGWCDRNTEDEFNCAKDCPCTGSGLFQSQRAACGNGVCETYGACGGPETCRTCRADCGPCEWKQSYGELPFTEEALHGVWGSSASQVFVAGEHATIIRRN